MDVKEAEKLYKEFQELFPLDKLRKLTLEEYTNLDREDSFCYWLETKTDSLGGFGGGSAYKFGIYKSAGAIKYSGKASNDGEYAWYTKYGNTKEIAFNRILSNIVAVAEAAQNHEFSKIDNVDLGLSYKWKIAYLYSNMSLLHIYAQNSLRYLAQQHGLKNYKKAPISEIQRYLIGLSQGKNLFEYSDELWNEWLASDEFKKSKGKDLEDDEDNLDSTPRLDSSKTRKNMFIRYKTSLLAKPFVILTGNSGTGKTKIATKLADYYKVQIPVYDKKERELFEFVLKNNLDMNGVSLKSVSSNAIEVYNTQGKCICISYGIIHEYINWYKLNGILSKPARKLMQEQGEYDGQSYSWDTTQIEKIAKYVYNYEQKTKTNVYSINQLLIPVGADWTDNTKILGYYNPLANRGAGEYVKTDILNFIEIAIANPDVPFFLILDEMNLSHVERYFSDFLSKMELLNYATNEKVFFDITGYGKLELPKNLFITGTVNIDETTYMFSPKVLDRANVIEFKPEMDDVLQNLLDESNDNEIGVAEDGVAEGFMQLANKVRSEKIPLEVEQILKEIQSILKEFYEKLKLCGFEFAYRTAKEIRLYTLAAYETADGNSVNATNIADVQILQKILPKIHGNKKQIGELLDNLDQLCEKKMLPLSREKIVQMKDKLNRFQYASFI